MDERDMEEETKDIEREGWGKKLKMLFVDFFMLNYVYVRIINIERIGNPLGQNKLVVRRLL
jgi:hypothetical protein